MDKKAYKLGSVEASEQLIQDLYISLRQKVRHWASLTHQTAQARMGYIGQHLTSVVTGLTGGRSGARGKDLVLEKGEFAEIKTCYRVDQLGKCNSCESPVASIESECPKCHSTDLKRNDDSKWLIGIRNKQEFENILEPKYYFLVLFEFLDINGYTGDIQSSIWRVDPKAPGFSFCMVDYYYNIQAKSKSKAPFNLWPYQLKFDLMRPVLIYRSIIKSDDSIKTQIFPGRNEPQLNVLSPLVKYSRSQNLKIEKIISLAKYLDLKGIIKGNSKDKILKEIQDGVERAKIPSEILTDALAHALYFGDIKKYLAKLPSAIKKHIHIQHEN